MVFKEILNSFLFDHISKPCSLSTWAYEHLASEDQRKCHIKKKTLYTCKWEWTMVEHKQMLWTKVNNTMKKKIEKIRILVLHNLFTVLVKTQKFVLKLLNKEKSFHYVILKSSTKSTWTTQITTQRGDSLIQFRHPNLPARYPLISYHFSLAGILLWRLVHKSCSFDNTKYSNFQHNLLHLEQLKDTNISLSQIVLQRKLIPSLA